MGLCYDSLGQKNIANEAYRQAWKTLLEQRDRKLKRETIGTNKSVMGRETCREDIGTILRHASEALGVSTSGGLANELGEEGVADGEGGVAPPSGPRGSTSGGSGSSGGGGR